MISKYEEKIRLTFLLNYFKCLDFSEIENVKYFLQDLYKIKYISKNIENVTPLTFNKYKKHLILDLKRHLKGYKNIKISALQKSLNNFADVFTLTPLEKEVYSVFIRFHLFDESYNFLKRLLNCYDKIDYRAFLKLIPSSSPKKILIAFTSLKQNGLLSEIGKGKFYLSECNHLLYELFTETEIIKKEDFRKSILGQPLPKSNLRLSDFQHKKDDCNNIVNLIKNSTNLNIKGINILFYGKVGTGKTELTKLITQKANLKLYFVKNIDSLNREMDRKDRLCDLRQKACLKNKLKFCILFDEAEDVLTNDYFFENTSSSKSYVNNLLEETDRPIFWTTNRIHDIDKSFLRRMTYVVKFDDLTEDTKLKIWKNEFKKQDYKYNKNKLVELNKKYNVAPSLISNAVTVARLTQNSDCITKNLDSMLELLGDKNSQLKANSNNLYLDMYRLDLVNCKNDISFLTEKIVKSGNLNFSLCLFGESGTGKSAYARYLANKLSLPIVFKSSSDLLGKYVGETEQNIANAFNDARSKKAMLIFDEADSFLNSRVNAEKSWEISQVNEMLTQMENYEYPFVCTTNLIDRIDEASLRRFMFKLKFNFLTREQIKIAFKHFFKINASEEIINIKGLTTSDMNNVMQKAQFLNIENINEISNMLQEEVSLKKADELKLNIGF